MRVLHLLTSGNVGGIEVLCRDIGSNSVHKHVFAFLFGEGLVFDDMKKMGMNVVSLAGGSKLTKARLDKLISLAKEQDVVIVHHNDPFLEMYYLAIKAILPEKKYISMIHHCYDPKEDAENYGIPKRIVKDLIVTRMFRKSDKLIFVSKAGMESYTGKYPVDMGKTAVVYNGIGMDKLMHRMTAGKNDGSPVKLLYAGRLEKIKGVSLLIDAIKLLENEDIEVTVVGDGSQRKRLEEQVDSLHLREKVRFEGFQTDVKPWMETANIFVYPSKMEIFGISLVEAMAFRCICVANAVGGIPEIIQDGENGFLNYGKTPKDLAISIQKAIAVWKDPNKRSIMMDYARVTAEKFSILDTIEALETEVSSIVYKG